MNCSYCHQSLSIYSCIDPQQGYCSFCKANYYFTNNSLISVTWSLRLNYTIFYFKVYDGMSGNAPEFVVSYFNIDFNTGIWEELIRWDFIPDWTPLNSNQKIKKLLPFI